MADEAPETTEKIAKKSSFPFIPLLNTLAILGASGFFIYTKFIYKPVKITEQSERKKLADHYTQKPIQQEPIHIQFGPMTINIKSIISQETKPNTPSGKLHYATLSFTLQLEDETYKEAIESKVRPFINDRVILLLGKKQFHELTNIQGRYILQSELIESLNELIIKQLNLPPSTDIISQIYFTQLVVQ